MLQRPPIRCRMSRPTALFVLLIVAPLAAAASSDPRDVVTRLYDVIQAPTSNETAISPLLGEALRSTIAAQRAYEQACTALAAPDEKPHMLDQSPYLLAPDRPETISVGMPGSSGDATGSMSTWPWATTAGPTGSCCSGRTGTGRSWIYAGAGRQPDWPAQGVLGIPLHTFGQLAGSHRATRPQPSRMKAAATLRPSPARMLKVRAAAGLFITSRPMPRDRQAAITTAGGNT